MSDEEAERMRATADRLGFELSPELLEQCLGMAHDLETTADELDAAGEVPAISDPDVTPSGDDRALLATYAEPRREREAGLLADETVAVKDNIAAADLVMTCGSDRVGVRPDTDAVVLERLLESGAAVVGKANMDAFALGPSGEFSDYGPVVNPIGENRVPGGSSSGSGVAVATGGVDIALGSDTGGSVRIPAACCGVVGHKPTHGYVPRHGFVPFAPSLDTIGPLARDVETTARALAAIAGADPRDPTSSGRPPTDVESALEPPEAVTVGLPTAFFEMTDEPVAEAVRDAAEAAPFETTDVEVPLGSIEEAYFLIGGAEFVWYLEQGGITRGQGTDYGAAINALVSAAKAADLGDHITGRILPAAHLDTETGGETYRRARREGIEFERGVRSALEAVDALVLPTLRTLPPERGQMETAEDMLTLLGNTAPFNVARTPSTSVPVGEVDGLPVSAQVVTQRFRDFESLAVAALLEERSAIV